MSIATTSFSMNKLTAEAYAFNIMFASNEKSLSSKRFIFTHKNKEKGDLVDIYSLNSQSSELTGTFCGRDIKCLKEVVKQLDLSSKRSTLLTVDIKNVSQGYLDPCIRVSEVRVCEFLSHHEKSSSKSANQARELLQGKLDYVFCEGSLKSDLLKQFEEKEIEFLNSKEGALTYCKLTEVFMNAAKFGHACESIDAGKFIVDLSPTTHFHPHSESTIWYPKRYKQSSKEVASMFSPVFTTSLSFDHPTGITSLTMKELL